MPFLDLDVVTSQYFRPFLGAIFSLMSNFKTLSIFSNLVCENLGAVLRAFQQYHQAPTSASHLER